MHELGLMEQLRERVLAEAAAAAAARVLTIQLRIGALAGVEPEALAFAAEVVLAGSIAAGAALQIETVPALGFCRPCGGLFPAGAAACPCPDCGGMADSWQGGTELELVGLEVT